MVGLSGMVIDFGITYLLKEYARLHKYLANAIGFSLAATNNFYWNKYWTFEDTNVEISQQYLSFVIVSLIGLGINTLVLMVLEKKMQLNFLLRQSSGHYGSCSMEFHHELPIYFLSSS